MILLTKELVSKQGLHVVATTVWVLLNSQTAGLPFIPAYFHFLSLTTTPSTQKIPTLQGNRALGWQTIANQSNQLVQNKTKLQQE